MDTFGFLVAANLAEAIRLWRNASLQEILEEALRLAGIMRQKNNQDFDRFLRESDSEEVQRRIGIIQEFLESGLDPNDPGLCYLNDLLFRNFEEARMAQYTCGLPAPHRNGLNDLIAEFQKVAILLGSECNLLEIITRTNRDYSLKSPADYFDKLLELKSCWMSPPFPLFDIQDGILGELSNRLNRPINFEILSDPAPPAGTLSKRIPVAPFSIPETSNRSCFHLIDKKTYLDAYSHLSNKDIQSAKNRAEFSREDSEKLDSMVGSFRHLLTFLQEDPECELLLVIYTVEEDV